MAVQIIIGDCRKVLEAIPDGTFHCVVTSPPFWGLRDYGLPPLVWGGDSECEHVWGSEIPGDSRGGSGLSAKECYGGNDGKTTYARQVARGNWCQHCGAWLGSLGLEPTPELYVEHLAGIFRQVRRVLRDDGTVWLNLGDSYAGNRGNTAEKPGCDNKAAGNAGANFHYKGAGVPSSLKPKDLIGIPWRVAFALQADGWWLRSDIIWEKPNCMPESVKDRPTCSHEHLFLLAKAARYFYDADAIREEAVERSVKMPDNWATHSGGHGSFHRNGREKGQPNNAIISSRNKRTVWTIATYPFPEVHFATFPPALVEPCIKAGTSERGCCSDCGAPWERVTERIVSDSPPSYKGSLFTSGKTARHQQERAGNGARTVTTQTIGWRPTCSCSASEDAVPCRVLDLFGGAGTTGLVAERLGRDCTLIDLKAEYGEMARARILKELGPMFTQVSFVSGKT